ncbi:DUF86 domain-containing protein [Candidatus Bathyarchaeota archaeon]|nr:MAG: DUF86 domain-containing protein [Candidatus Bathyarchaeota archaeon]
MNRRMRYLDKLRHIDKRISNIRRWLPELGDEKTKLAIYKAFQEIVEAIFDIIAMKLVDLRIPPKDNYANLEELERRGMMEGSLLDTLREANGLRNRLVHSYNTLSDEIALKSIELLLPKLERVREVMEGWI